MRNDSNLKAVCLGTVGAIVLIVTLANFQLLGSDKEAALEHQQDAGSIRLRTVSSAETQVDGGSMKIGAGLLFLSHGPTPSSPRQALLLKRKDKGNKINVWGLPGGNMDDTDQNDLLNTAMREATEELGVLPTKFEITGSVRTVRGKRKQKQFTVFVALVPRDIAATYAPQLNTKEHTDWKWFSLRQLIYQANNDTVNLQASNGMQNANEVGGLPDGASLHKVVEVALGPKHKNQMILLTASNTVAPKGPSVLGLISTPSCNSLNSEVMGFSPRSTESGSSVPYFIRASQLGLASSGPKPSLLITWLLHVLASCAVTTYDLLMRVVMPSWYLLDLHLFQSSNDYLHSRAEKKTRRYVEAATEKFLASLTNGQISLLHKPALDEEDFEFAKSVFCNKHGKPVLLYLAWRAFVTLLSAAPYYASFTTVVDNSSNTVLAVFVEFRQGNDVHHFITALVDHEASKRHGIYIAKYDQMISACTQDGVHMLRMGPTTDALKASLGGVRLPLFVVGSPVWGRWQGRCSFVAFGIFTTIGLFAFLWLTQWQMDASGMGRLTTAEFFLLYGCCIAFVKTLPLFSIGWLKVLSNPKKYLLQTSFYAQGVIFGGFMFVALASYNRGINPLRLLDAICMFALVGDCIGRLGCHWYGCCFGRPLLPPVVSEAPANHAAAADKKQSALQESYDLPSGYSAPSSISSSPLSSGNNSDAEPATFKAQAVGKPPKPAATKAASEPVTTPVHPLSVVYYDRDSSVLRLRPELRLKPLLPTQLLQALYAAFFQAAMVAWLAYQPTVKIEGENNCFYHPALHVTLASMQTGVMGCAILGLYSIGRCIFFFLREDEVFKSNRSYTTVYIAAGTLAVCVLLGTYTHCCSHESTTFAVSWVPSRFEAWSYTIVAAATAGVNFIVQGLHHHEMIGRFPDPAALFAPIKRQPTPLTRYPSTAGSAVSRSSFSRTSLGSKQVYSNWN